MLSSLGLGPVEEEEDVGATQVREIMRRLTTLESENKKLKGRVSTLEEELDHQGHGEQSKMNNDHKASEPWSMGGNARTFEEYASRLNKLEKAISTVGLEVRGGAVEMGGTKFESAEACAAWIALNVPKGLFELMFDVISLSHSTKPEFVTAKDQSEENHTTVKAGYRSLNEARIVASMSTMLPYPYGTKGRPEPKNPLPGILSGAAYGYMMTTGLHREMSDSMNTATNEMRGVLNHAHGYSDSGIRVTGAMIEGSEKHNRWLMSTAGTLYNYFGQRTGDSEAEKKKNWFLTARTISLLFKQVKELRNGAARSQLPSSMSSSERVMYAGKLMWAALRTHQFMDAVLTKTIYQMDAYQDTIMEHVVENLMSLSHFDGMKDKALDQDNRLNRLELHCKVKRPPRPKSKQ